MKYVWTALIIIGSIVGIAWARGRSQPLTQAEFSNSVPESAEPQEREEPQGDKSITNNKKTTQHGMTIEILTEGTGAEITNGQTAVVQYEGTLVDGSIFDSTAKHGGRAFEFPLGAGMVIKGWDQGILGMKVGETRKLTIPPELGYGPQGYPPIIPQSATLVFKVTLEGIK